jgi:diguanylate cyclase (GGDEF)-like protein
LTEKANNEQQFHDPSPYNDPTVLGEALLRLHSATSEAWLVEAAMAAAERSLGALYTFVFLFDSSGRLVGQQSPSEGRARSLSRAHSALGQPLARLKLTPSDDTLLALSLRERHPITIDSLAEALNQVIDSETCQQAQQQLGIANCCVSPIEMSAEQLGVALLLFGNEHAPISHVTLLCEHLARALLNLREQEAGRRRGELDAVRWVSDERRFAEQFERELGRANRHQRPLSILLMRVANFQEVRAQLGRFLADRLLRRIGAILSEQIRGSDFLGAYGDDGFALIMAEANAAAAAEAAQRLMPMTSSVQLEGGGTPTPHLYYGTATFPEDGSTVEALIAAAEVRLHPLSPEQAETEDDVA